MELESFLSSFPTPNSPISASPKDDIRFLVWKDSREKTKIHIPSCSNFRSHSKRKCGCPSRLAAGTVDNTIGKLRSSFNAVGLSGDWSGLCPGKPAAHPSVQKYLVSISEEQAKARVPLAKPCLFSSTSSLSCALTYAIERFYLPYPPWKGTSSAVIWPSSVWISTLVTEHLTLVVFILKEVLLLPGKQGLLSHHKFEKTLRGKDTNVFAVKTCPHDSVVCPVVNVTTYVKLADLMNIKLRKGLSFCSVPLTQKATYLQSLSWALL